MNKMIVYYDKAGNELARFVFDPAYANAEDVDRELFPVVSTLFPVDNSSENDSEDDAPLGQDLREFIVTLFSNGEELVMGTLVADWEEHSVDTAARKLILNTMYNVSGAKFYTYLVGDYGSYMCYADVYRYGPPVVLDVCDAASADDARKQAAGRAGEYADKCTIVPIHGIPVRRII